MGGRGPEGRPAAPGPGLETAVVCQPPVPRLTFGQRRVLPAGQLGLSSTWNSPWAESGSRLEKDIDSLDGVQRRALAPIKGLRA